MIPRILNLQGMIGLAASLLLLIMVFVKAGGATLAQHQPFRAALSRRASAGRDRANYARGRNCPQADRANVAEVATPGAL